MKVNEERENLGVLVDKPEKLSSKNNDKIRKSALNCMYTNARSIMNNNKREEIGFLLEKHNVDILAITETWTNNDIEDAEIHFSGYTMFRKDRDTR